MNAKARLLVFALFMAGMLGFGVTDLLAAAITSQQSGNWNDASTWGGTIPDSDDDVTIAVGHTITVNAAVSAQSLIVNGTIRPDVSPSRTITVSGNVTVANTGTVTYNNSTGRLSWTLEDTDLTINRTVPGNANEQAGVSFYDLTINGTTTTDEGFTVYGNFTTTAAGNFTQATDGEVMFTNTAQRTITNNGALTFFSVELSTGSDVTSASDFIIAEDLTVAAGSVLSTSSFSTMTISGGTITNNGDITIGADATMAIAGATTITGNIDDMSGSMTMAGAQLTLGSSEISGTGSFTGASGMTLSLQNAAGVAGALQTSTVSLNDATTYTFSAGNSATGFAGVSVTQMTALNIDGDVTTAESFTVNGAITVSGTGSLAATAGTITTGASANIDNSGGADTDLTFFNLTVDGTAVTSTLVNDGITVAGSITVGADDVLDMNTQNITMTGTGTITNNNTFTIDGDILINGASSNVTLGSDLTIAANGTITLNNASATLDTDVYTITTSGSTVAELILTAGNVVTGTTAGLIGADPHAFAPGGNGEVSIASGINFTFDGTGTLTGLGFSDGASTLAGTGVTGQDVTSIGNLTIAGNTAATSLETAATMTVAGNITVNSGASLDLSAVATEIITITGAGRTISNSGTLDFAGLDIDGTVTTSSDFGVTGVLDIDAAGSLVASSPSTITNTTTGAQTTPLIAGGGTLTFYDVDLDATAGAMTYSGNYNVANDLTLVAGTYTATAAGNTVTMTGSSGEIEITAGTLTFGTLSISGNVTTDNDITIFAAGTLTTAGEFEMLSSGTPNLTYAAAGTLAGAGITKLYDLTCTGAVAATMTDTLYLRNSLTDGGAGTFNQTGAGVLYMDGAAAQTINVTNFSPQNVTIPSGADVEIDVAVTTAAGNTPAFDVDGILDIDAALTIAGGTMDIASTATIEVGVAGGLATTITGAGTINASSEASYIFDAAGAIGVDVASTVNIDGAASTPAGVLNVLGDVTMGAAMVAAATDDFTITGNLSVTTSYDGATNGGDIIMSGTAKTISNTGANAQALTFSNVEFDGSISMATASTNAFRVGAGGAAVLTVDAGSFDATTATAAMQIEINSTAAAIVNNNDADDLVFDGLLVTAINAASTAADFYVNGNWDNDAAFASTGTTYFGGTSQLDNAATIAFSNMNVTAAGSLTVNDDAAGPQINDTLTVDGTLDVNGTAVADNLTVDGGVITGTGTINLFGLTTSTAAVTTTSDITIDGDVEDAMTLGTAFTASSPSTITIETTGANFVSSANASFFNVIFAGAATTNDQNFTVTGDLTVNSGASIVSSAGTVTFDGASDKTITNNGTLTFFDLDIANTADNNVSTTSSFSIAGTSADSYNIVGSTGGTFSATNGTVTFSGAAGGITNGSDIAGRAQFAGLTFSGATNTIAVGDVINVSGDINFNNATSFTHTDDVASRITLNGTSQQTITVNKGMTGAVTLANLTLNNSNGARLLSSTTTALTDDEIIIGRRFVLSDGDFDLNGDNVLTIGTANGRLQETAGNTVINNGIPSSTGYVLGRNAGGAALINNNVGGLGARVSTDVDPGAVTVQRYHKPATVGGQESITRYYRITAANASLNSTLSLGYDESELGSITETDLLVFNSADVNDGGSNPWVNRIATQDTDNNNFRTRAINAYADSTLFWALAAPNVITASEITGTTKGISASPLTADRDSVVLYGLKLTPAGGEVTLDQLTFTFNRALNAGTAELSGYKLFVSEDNDFTTTSDNTFLATTNTGGGAGQTSIALDLTTNSTLEEGVDYHYFLVADVASTVTASTAALTVSCDNFGIGVIDGVVKTYSEAGTAYSFVPGYYLDYVSNGVSDSPIVAGQDNNVIFGFTIDATSAANFTGFRLGFSSDVENVLENARVFVSTDASYTTTGDNSAVTMASTPSFSGDSIVFTFNTAQSINVADKYYFIVADAKGGIDELTTEFTPSLMHEDITTTTAQPVYRKVGASAGAYADEVSGQSYEFVQNTVTIALTNDGVNQIPPASGNISKGVINQTLMGFTLTSDNNVAASFTGVTAHVNFASGAAASDFRDWKLWRDSNGNGYGDSGEQIAVGTLNTATPEGNLTFSSFSTAQTVSDSAKYIITAEVRSNATAGGTVTVRIPSSAYVVVTSPASVNDGGPYIANTQTIRTPGTATQLALVGNYARTVTSGGTVAFTVQARDANGYAANVTAGTTVVMSLSNNDGGESTIGGTVTGTIQNGRSYTTVSPSLTDADGSTVTTVIASDQAASLTATAASSAITILEAAPTTDASALTVANGATPTTQIAVNSWTAGNGDARIIVVRAGKIPHAPTDGVDYVPVTDIANGYNASNQTGPGSYVIYDGSGASAAFTVSGLTPDTKYYFAVYEYNGTGTMTNYKALDFASDNPVSHTTTAGGFGVISDSTSAAIIETGVDITGTLATSGDVDWYQFNVPANRNNVMVRLTNLPANYTIELYDRTTGTLADMTLIRKSEVASSGNETMILNAADAGRYLLKIYGNDSDQYSTSSYTVRVTTSATQLYSLPAGN